jgi:hypothetical protein
LHHQPLRSNQASPFDRPSSGERRFGIGTAAPFALCSAAASGIYQSNSNHKGLPMSELPADDLAKAAARALREEFGPHLETYVDKAAAGELEKPDANVTRDWNTIVGTSAAFVQLAWALIEVSKFAWRKYQELRDKAAVAKAAGEEMRLPGIPGETRDRIIDTVVEKL